MILLNPTIPTEWASRHLRIGGYVLANDYHGNASEMYHQPDQFTLWGVINFVEQDRRKEDSRVVVSRNLEDLFQPVKDAEEFQRLDPLHFEFIKSVVLSFIETETPKVNPNTPFEQKWAAYRKYMGVGMPYKMAADRYIFIKSK